MDKIRELRYVTPPIFFFGVLLFAFYLGGWLSLESAKSNLAVISALLVAGLFPVGFTIQSISINAQRWWFGRYEKQPYMACFADDKTWQRIASAVHVRGNESVEKYQEAASIAFQFEKWDKQMVDAVVRLWTAFNIAVGSIVAIFSATELALLIIAYRCFIWPLTLAIVAIVVLSVVGSVSLMSFAPKKRCAIVLAITLLLLPPAAILAVAIWRNLGLSWYSEFVGWVVGSALLVMLFRMTARSTWIDHMRAFEFQALRLDDNGYMPCEKGYVAPPDAS